MKAASKKWTMPVRSWKMAMSRFMLELPEQLAAYIK
jgi:transposase-like protein